MRSRRVGRSQEIGGQSARNSLLLCLKGIESVQTGEKVAI